MIIWKEKRVCLLLIIVITKVVGYEKTLRKIVRNQKSKMVQTPFSGTGEGGKWKNATIQTNEDLMFSGLKTVIHKIQRPKVSTILSSLETSRGKSAYTKFNADRKENMFPSELRYTRNTYNVTANTGVDRLLFPDSSSMNGKNNLSEISVNTYYEIPSQSKFFPPIEERNSEQKSITENTIIIPETKDQFLYNNSLLVQGIYVSNSEMKPPSTMKPPSLEAITDLDSDRVDYLIQEKSIDTDTNLYHYNVSLDMFTCAFIKKSVADIDAQEKFSEFDIEPSWMSKKHYWNTVFDSRYEALMRSPEWPPLKVILVPRTQVDSIWKRSFERSHNDTVHQIISNVVKKMHFYSNLTFTWNEVSHLSHWWKTANTRSRSAFRRLVKSGRLEITTGGWVESDEATSDLFGMVHQLIEGHQWLKNHLNYVPTVAWLTNSVAHSPTMTYLLSASGITKLILTNLHYSWEQYLAEYQLSDFIWLQSWEGDKEATTDLNKALNRLGKDRFPKHSALTHYLQFNSDGFKACGPDKMLCVNQFNFKSNKNLNIFTYNIKEKSEMLLEQYSKTGTITAHNVIIAPVGNAYHYEYQPDFDYQYNNYLKLADFINSNSDVYKATIEFGTPTDYFNTILERIPKFPTVRGDFVNFADINNGSPAYWTGYFTTRPLFKILLRRLLSTLRTTEILFSFAASINTFQQHDVSNLFKLLIDAREITARLQDRNVVSGTLSANGLKYAHQLILTTVKNCWYIQEVAASLISIKPNKISQTPYLLKFVYRDGEFMSAFRTVGPGDQVYIFNSLSHERTEILELIVRNPNIRIIDHNKKDVTFQINPMWKYTSDNYIRISRRYFKIVFAIVIPPMTLELYRIKGTYDASLSAATIYCLACGVDELTGPNGTIFPFNIQPIQPGDIQLESYKLRLIFDELTGLLKHVVEKFTNTQKRVILDYGAFKSSDKNAGMFLFNTNVTKPLLDVLLPFRIGTMTKIVIITSGQVTTELTSIYGRLLQNTVKIFNLLNSPLSNTIYIESKVDFEVSPKNRELEMFLSIQTDIGNGNPPELYTDNNGFQYTKRILNISRRIESNMYPMTTMAYIQDFNRRMTIVTDHAQGVTALQEGQILVMLDRRVLFNDGRGTPEGLADSSATCHRHFLLLENFVEASGTPHAYSNNLQLPSLSAIHLANSMNYLLDIFIIDKNQSDFCHYAFLPLIKTSFPCDVSLVNFRLMFNKGSLIRRHPTSALMILYRQSMSCQMELDVQIHCNGENSFLIGRILHRIKAVYQTNLAGTEKGVPITSLNKFNFPPMELTSLRVYF